MYSDPFDDLSREVDSQLGMLHPQLHSYIQSLSSKSPAVGPSPATPTHDQLINIIEELDLTLTDLQQSVDVAARTPEHFGLTKDQVEDRRMFVEARQNEVDRIRQQIEAVEQRGMRGPGGQQRGQEFTSINIDDDGRGNAGVPKYSEEFEREQQMLLMRDQDEQLDSVMGTVQNLREQAAVMHTELQDQVEMLQDLDDHVDRTQTKLNAGMSRIRWILKKNEETASNCCIILLTIVLVLLLLVVLFA
ncbi:hypothetical protein V1511DRAFT_501407 [Dipodascopsis uninucleata]